MVPITEFSWACRHPGFADFLRIAAELDDSRFVLRAASAQTSRMAGAVLPETALLPDDVQIPSGEIPPPKTRANFSLDLLY
jgi:hypothetical protein